MEPPSPVALVLSGGGARGAYEAGVLAGIGEVLDDHGGRPLFDLLVGTSVGAINAAHVASHAHERDRGIPNLVRLWQSLELGTHLHPHLTRLVRDKDWPHGQQWGRAVLDAKPFERLIENEIPWKKLHENIAAGRLGGLIVSALNIASGRTFTFSELAPGRRFIGSRDPYRASRIESVTADHVLASAALPLLFPARRIRGSFFCDGGLRFNTPIAPAMRAGARKLVIVALRAQQTGQDEEETLEQYPNPVFLLGKVLDALLLDPIDYDLQVLERVNRILGAFDATADSALMQRFHAALESSRGLSYARVKTLVFRPSQDIGVLAREHLRQERMRCVLDVGALLLERAAALGTRVEADVLSFLLFDGDFARRLIDLGRRDVLARESEVRAFFDATAP